MPGPCRAAQPSRFIAKMDPARLRYTCLRMPSESFIEAVNSLSPEEETSVLQFIGYLKQRSTSGSSAFLQAADEFIAAHPELLHRLSQ